MSSTTADDPNKPVTGYPTTGYPPAQPSYHHPTGYPSIAQQSYPTTGTAYPYTAPPPAAYYNPNPYPPPNYDPRRATFLRRLIIAGITVFLIIGAITFILWLVIRPHLPEFRVESASVSNFNVSSSQLNANWKIGFLVRNPNKKMSIFYDRIGGTVYYRAEALADNSLVPFYQSKKNQTAISAMFTASGSYVDDRSVQQMLGDRSRGSVNFNVVMVAYVRFKSGAWRTRKHVMRIYCQGVTIGFSSNSGGTGNLTGGSRECEVDM